MRLLFEMDQKDYRNCTHSFTRNSARSIIIRDGRIAMIHSLRYDYYKFPGGGIEKGEDPVDAVIRETREEAGLLIVPGSVREYGFVHRIQKSDRDDSECFIQDNYYYLCEAEKETVAQDLDAYEAEEQFRLEYVDPAAAIEKNRHVGESPYNRLMFEREARVLELLIADGFLGRSCESIEAGEARTAIEIRPIDEADQQDINIPNEPFALFGRMIPSYMDRRWSYTVERSDTESEMSFPDEHYDYEKMKADSVFLGAYDGERCIGLAILQQGFFRYMYLYDLKVNKAYRGRGVAGRLIEAAKEAAADRGYQGIWCRGQDNNLGACLFYINSGFRIGGLDTEVYKGTNQEGKADILFYLDC